MDNWFRLNTIALRVTAPLMIAVAILGGLMASELFCPTVARATEPSRSGLVSQVPLRVGLTIVATFHFRNVDYEPILTVTNIDDKAVNYSLSSDQPQNCPTQGDGESTRRWVGRRTILREDLQRAHAYWQGTKSCVVEPVLIPGKTGFSVSSSVMQELKAKGKTRFSHTYANDVTAHGVLTRIEHEPVPFEVILNDERVQLATIHARWQSYIGDQSIAPDQDYWILDDVNNPLVLYASQGGKPFWGVTKLSFPTNETAARLEQNLSKDGRTVIYGIYFDFASARIREESEPVLKEIADVMTKNPTWRLMVEGHTDNIGGDEANLLLSQRRSAEVRRSLSERYKIAPTRLESAGLGETKPKATNETVEGRALNRRVELVRIGR